MEVPKESKAKPKEVAKAKAKAKAPAAVRAPAARGPVPQPFAAPSAEQPQEVEALTPEWALPRYAFASNLRWPGNIPIG